MLMLAPLLMILAASTSNMSQATAKQQLNEAAGAILRGDGRSAQTILRGISAPHLEPRNRAFRMCFLNRLASSPPTVRPSDNEAGSPFSRQVLALYRRYWRASVMKPADNPDAERALLKGLSALLGTTLHDVDAAEPLISARLAADGLHSQQGRTGVLHDLMIWTRESERIEQVALPEGSNPTKVNYLDGFLSRGWSSYFTCDRTGTGGWTTDEGLFVIVPAYASLTDETFRVNFRAHESQHYADKKRFGELPAWQLEYRAKLVEVIFAQATLQEVLAGFETNLGDDSTDPHSYANKRILGALSTELGVQSATGLQSLPAERLHEAAQRILKQDSDALERQRNAK